MRKARVCRNIGWLSMEVGRGQRLLEGSGKNNDKTLPEEAGRNKGLWVPKFRCLGDNF